MLVEIPARFERFVPAMHYESPPQISLGGGLLLADPSLRDPNFSRTVLFLSHHSGENGAEGYILNRPIDRTVGQMTPSKGLGRLRKIRVFIGGPVKTEHLVLASLRWDSSSQRFAMEPRLSPEDALSRLAEGVEIRAFIGHSGWSAGQLEAELRERAWIPRRADANVLRWKPTEMWSHSLETLSPWHRLLSRTPEDPSLN